MSKQTNNLRTVGIICMLVFIFMSITCAFLIGPILGTLVTAIIAIWIGSAAFEAAKDEEKGGE